MLFNAVQANPCFPGDLSLRMLQVLLFLTSLLSHLQGSTMWRRWSLLHVFVSVLLVEPAYTRMTCISLSSLASLRLIKSGVWQSAFHYCQYETLNTHRKGRWGRRRYSCHFTRESMVRGSRLYPQIIIVKCDAPDNERTQVLIV